MKVLQESGPAGVRAGARDRRVGTTGVSSSTTDAPSVQVGSVPWKTYLEHQLERFLGPLRWHEGMPVPGCTAPRRRYARSGIASWVYFIQQVGDGLIKIGFATDVDRRLDALQVGSPVHLRVLLVVPGSRATERELHHRFAEHRAHGEWFRPAEELTEFIAENVFSGMAPDENAAGLRAEGGTFAGMWRCTRCGALRCDMGACPMCTMAARSPVSEVCHAARRDSGERKGGN